MNSKQETAPPEPIVPPVPAPADEAAPSNPENATPGASSRPAHKSVGARPGHGHSHGHIRGKALGLLAVTALGVVYGDIGTSPLYAFRECFSGHYGIEATPDNVLGVLSLIFWSLIIVITLKYVTFILRADNHGEGGILALTALATPLRRIAMSRQRWLVLLGVFGAALLYGDGVITPAISVLSAVEGLNTVTPLLHPYVVPITIVIIIALFMIQRNGTARIGGLFGPIMVVWFAVIAILGVMHIVQAPYVLAGRQPTLWRELLYSQRMARFPCAGHGLPGGDRRRGALCRHGALRPQADSPGLVHLRPARPAAKLLWPGRAGAAAAGAGREFVLHARPLLGAAAARGVGDSRHHYRFAGPDLGCLFAHDAGRKPRVPTSPADRPHVGDGFWPDLHSDCELAADVYLHWGRALFPIVYASGRGLRHRRNFDHGDHHDHICRGCAQSLAVERALGGCASSPSSLSSTWPFLVRIS